MTSISDQDSPALGGPLSILTRQKRDHQHLDHLLHRLERSAPGTEEDLVLHRLARLVFPHAFAEESVLWPEVRRVLPDTEELTLRVEQEHQEVNELWTSLEVAPPGSPARAELLAHLATVLREDVRDEEDELLPRLQEAVGSRRLQVLGLAWEAVRRTAPTRPHPVVARRPPGNVLAAVPLSVLDRSRDVLDAAGRRSPRLHAPVSRSSDRLAAVAGRVERLGWFRRGEHPSTHRAGEGGGEHRQAPPPGAPARRSGGPAARPEPQRSAMNHAARTSPLRTPRTVQRPDVALSVHEGGNPEGPTLVMVHGWPDTHRMWRGVAALLAPDLRVVAYDTRGQGLSLAAPGASYALSELAADLRAVLDAVSPEAPVHVLGHDWGSIQAWEAVCEPGAEGRISSFISMSGPNLDHLSAWARRRLGRPTPRGVAELAAQAVSSAYVPFFLSPLAPPLLRVAGRREVWRRVVGGAGGRVPDPEAHAPSLAHDMASGLRYYRANARGASGRPRPRTTGVPVLQLVLTRDPAVRRSPLTESDRWTERLERRHLPHGHWVALTHPEVVAEEVARFVRSIEGPIEGLSARA